MIAEIWALGVTHSGELDRRNDSASIRAHSIVQRRVTTPKMSMPNCRLIEQGVRDQKNKCIKRSRTAR